MIAQIAKAQKKLVVERGSAVLAAELPYEYFATVSWSLILWSLSSQCTATKR